MSFRFIRRAFLTTLAAGLLSRRALAEPSSRIVAPPPAFALTPLDQTGEEVMRAYGFENDVDWVAEFSVADSRAVRVRLGLAGSGTQARWRTSIIAYGDYAKVRAGALHDFRQAMDGVSASGAAPCSAKAATTFEFTTQADTVVSIRRSGCGGDPAEVVGLELLSAAKAYTEPRQETHSQH